MRSIYSRLIPKGYSDLRLVELFVLGTLVVYLVPGVPMPIRILAAVPLLLVVPGYPVHSMLYPAKPTWDSSPDWVARIGITLVSSVLVVAVIGFLLTVTIGLSTANVVILIAAFSLISLQIAHWRRKRTPEAGRASPTTVVRRSVPGVSASGRRQTVVVIIVIVLLVTTIGYAGTGPVGGEPFTEVYLLPDTDDRAPENQTAGDNYSTTVSVGIENHEQRPMDYGIIVLARFEGPNGSTIARRVVSQRTLSVENGARKTPTFAFERTPSADRILVRILVWKGTIPPTANPGSADFDVHRWIEGEADTDG